MRILSFIQVAGVCVFVGILFFGSHAVAEIVPNPVAEFAGLDKITGRITSFDVYLDETQEFGNLKVTPRVCNSRPLTEKPHTIAFIEVDEVTLENEIKRIFTGWMLASSPALNALEHGIFDVWLTDCKKQTSVLPPENYAGLPVEIIEESEEKNSKSSNDHENSPVPRPKPRSLQ